MHSLTSNENLSRTLTDEDVDYDVISSLFKTLLSWRWQVENNDFVYVRNENASTHVS